MSDFNSRRNIFKMLAAASVLPFVKSMPVVAQGKDTLVVVTG